MMTEGSRSRPRLRARVGVRAGAVLLALGLLACIGGGVGARGGLSEQRVAGLEPEVSEAYALFARKCSRCHSLARPLSAQVDSMDHWRAYVARMRRNPGSGISPADGDRILVFLEWWMTHRGAEPAVKEAE